MDNHPSRATDDLLRKMWQTKSARFNAHHRLERRHRISIGATSLLSCYLVAISLYQIVFESSISPIGIKLLSVTNIVVSVFLIMITLIESARNYGTEAERMRENALAISRLYNEFQALTTTEADQRRDRFASDYSGTLSDAQLNHKDLDRNLFRIPNARELKIAWPDFLLIILNTALLLVLEYWLYLSLVLVPPLLFWHFLPRL
ncbi:hypothetical protein ASE69_20730 [Sphingomonas sp. Leaf208]|uniref:SLATT domain-containing protein n=1 Tax=Sphingomonas sp. Leaf208 TaxID=1735679 RepID=UPI0006F1DC91|nr:SLATT domain-containing protein [Sphingomonas sp. Leaf208]KQM51517.1 hypothetical protein ASE69_20730 [Sphingomonas sp. Leaf208]